MSQGANEYCDNNVNHVPHLSSSNVIDYLFEGGLMGVRFVQIEGALDAQPETSVTTTIDPRDRSSGSARAGAGHEKWRCKKCSTLWRLNPPSKVQPHGSWSLYDGEAQPGKCCDNSDDFRAVIEPVVAPPQTETRVEELERRLGEWVEIAERFGAALLGLAHEAGLDPDTTFEAQHAGASVLTRLRELKDWREAVIDGLVVSHIYGPGHDEDPRKALRDLVAWEVQVALDPAVSRAAQALIDRGAREALTALLPVFQEASERRYTFLKECVAEADTFKDEDMYGWNFHMGMGSGANQADIYYARIGRAIKARLTALMSPIEQRPPEAAPSAPKSKIVFCRCYNNIAAKRLCLDKNVCVGPAEACCA